MEQINLIAAAKRLNRLRVRIVSEPFEMELIWCRTVYARYERWDKKNHSHSFYELHFALTGSCEFLNANQYPVVLDRSNFIIIPPNHPHMLIDVSEDFEKFVMAFRISVNSSHPDGMFVAQALDKAKPHQVYNATSRMHGYVNDIIESAYMRQPALPSLTSAYLTLFLLEAACQISPLYYDDMANRKTFESDAQIENVRGYIADNILHRVTGKAVAQHFGISEKQMNRLLKANLNTTLSKIIEEEKMNRLRSLLTTDMTLNLVAEQAGFSNEYNMSRFFKRIEGMSPGRYRKAFEK